MKQVFFIDPIEKLNPRKDSTLMLALSFQQKGHEAYVLFEKDFFITNEKIQKLHMYKFSGEFEDDGCYVKNFTITDSIQLEINREISLHMRIDPPYDSRYQRYLWMLDFMRENTGCTVLNDPLKIMKYNEKLIAYKDLERGHLSYIGASMDGFNHFTTLLKEHGYDEVILKPLDLYSGIGVEKVSLLDHKNLQMVFQNKVVEFKGAIVCQPFIKEVYQGEYRSIYFDGKELGTIIKKPKEGEYLANIAQGAHFEKIELTAELKKICNQIAMDLYNDGVRLLAFDLLGGKVNEVNITCPGLLVEVSYAFKKNLCFTIVEQF